MRILALVDEEKKEYSVFTVVDVFYDDEFNGIGMVSQTGHFYYIPNISLNRFNFICREIALRGYYDLTDFGELQEYIVEP